MSKLFNFVKKLMFKKEIIMSEIVVDGVIYKKIQYNNEDTNVKKMKYVIARTYSAGVFAGYLESREGKVVILKNARRLWSWEGAASLSQLAMEGVKKPNECKFPCEVESVLLTELIEMLDVTESARKNIAAVPVWSA